MPWYHYTSREGAQGVLCAGLRPGASGKIYLTPTLYTEGTSAANYLGITGKPVEMGFHFLDNTVPSYLAPTRIEHVRGSGGIVMRRGRGLEVGLAGTVLRPSPDQCFSLREP